ncbi:MAG: IclR family transcriptional regulator, partial [Eubacteriales bacterium]|nr:IclR family transcriptional regulator [Eubacteriales bacterium]
MAIPSLEQLVKLFQETVNLVIRDDDSIVYLEKVESTHSMSISTTVGGRLPLYCTAAGKVILANLPQAEQTDQIEKINFVSFTEKTINSKALLEQSLQEIVQKGYAEDLEELQVGLICVSAPIYNHHGIPF